MTFKEFAQWSRERCCDGKWGADEALFCVHFCDDIYKIPFWKREKAFKKDSRYDMAVRIVDETERIINQ